MSDSIWKKEIRLRKPKEPKAPKQAEQVEAAPAEAKAPRPRGTVVVPVVPERSEAVVRLERWSARVPGSHTEFPHTPRPVARPAEPEPELVRPEPQPVQPEPVAVSEPVAEVAAPAPVQEKVPLLKRELRLRKPKAEKQPKVKQPKVKQPKAEKPKKAPKAPKLKAEKKPKAPKTPRAKRELHLPKPTFSLPRLPMRLGGGHKASDIVGLRIGSSQLAAAHIRNNGSAEVVHLGRSVLASGVVVNGEVRQPDALSAALKEFFAANKLPHKDIRLGIASNRIGVRMIEVPAVAESKQFENAIRFKAQEVLPIPVADAVLDHILLDQVTNDDGQMVRRVLLVFAHRELVSRYVDVCKQAGLRLCGIDLDAFALLRALTPTASPEGERQAIVAVAVGHERTVFAVSDGEVCEFTRVLEWGGAAIDAAMARALNLTPSQAAPLKHKLDLASTEPPEGVGAMEYEAARMAAKAEIAVLVRELVSSLRFYQSRSDSLAIKEILVTGGGSSLGGFAAELSAGVGAPVRVADPFARVVLAKRLQVPEDAGSLAIAVGLGIGD